MSRVKNICLLSALFGICLMLGACAIAEQDAAGVSQQFQDGLQGRGRIVPNNPSSDAFGADYR